jgi:hypothetical protein
MFDVAGASPVALIGTVEVLSGGAWSKVASVQTTDGNPAQITAAGTMGFSAGMPEMAGDYVYDNFARWR